MRELFGDAMRYFPFLAAGIDEQQIFLPVVEEAEIALRVAGFVAGAWPLTGGGCAASGCKAVRRTVAFRGIFRSRLDGAPVADGQP